jgi:molybdenum-dependent DNA-binding transcriptional regulator ModE
MRRDIIAMSQKERQRYHLLKMVIEGKITLKDAGRVMEISYRHAKRLKRKLISEGAKGLVHGNRGRPSPRALNAELAQRIIALSREEYANFNDTHFTEKLKEAEGMAAFPIGFDFQLSSNFRNISARSA